MNPGTSNWRDLVPLIRAVYKGHGAGCCWHVVFDDGNIDRECIDFCAKEAAARDCKPCLALARVVGQFSLTQVSKAQKRWQSP